MAVLVDSSIWIAASNNRNPECGQLRTLIEKNELIHLTRFIQTEVCQGARSEEQFHQLWDGLLGFDFLEVTTRHWGISAWNYFRCRKKGITLTTLDCVIGSLGAEYGVPVWSLGKNLLRAAPTIGFDVFRG